MTADGERRRGKRWLSAADQRAVAESARTTDLTGPDRSSVAGRWLPVPGTPPALLPGWTSWHWLIAMIGVVFGTAAVGIPLGKAFPAVAFPTMLASAGLALLVWRAHNVRWMDEIAAGYCTAPTVFGVPYFMGRRPDGRYLWVAPPSAMRVAWDDRGLWHLHPRTGAVVRARVRSAQAPGWYPSPVSAGRWELWTGARWTGYLHPGDPRPVG